MNLAIRSFGSTTNSMDNLSTNTFPDFKVLHVKSYTSQEWLHAQNKKYRRVFEASEVDYIYVEVAFHNKRFEIDAWEADLRLTCDKVTLDGYYLERICEIKQTLAVQPTSPVAYLREGYGSSRKGGFWQSGAYIWKVFVGEELIGECKCYVQDLGSVTSADNPYFEARSLRLFEWEHSLPPFIMRSYTTRFFQDGTRFIWAEFVFKNRVKDRDWLCELTFLFFNEARQLKGSMTELVKVTKEDNIVTICSGWGSDTMGTWYPGEFSIEVVFMEHVMGIIVFDIGAGAYKPRGKWLKNWKPSNWLRDKDKKPK